MVERTFALRMWFGEGLDEIKETTREKYKQIMILAIDTIITKIFGINKFFTFGTKFAGVFQVIFSTIFTSLTTKKAATEQQK